jgi:hypothetical protein
MNPSAALPGAISSTLMPCRYSSAMTRFLRYWLLRMVYEQRDLARQSAQAPTPLDD